MMPDRFYRTMYTIRYLEQRLQEYCDRGEAGDLHFSRGQESIAVGVCAALRQSDFICTHHRTIAHAISKGAELYPLVAELLGKRTGYRQGRAGEMHLSIPAIRYAFSFQIVGTSVPVAAGLAYAVKHHHQTDDVVVCFVGDAASSNGAFHEACTIAATKHVPLLIVCENNGLAGNVKPVDYLPTPNVRSRMAAYGIRSLSADGDDVRDVYDRARDAVLSVRLSGEPWLLEINVARLCFHKQGQGDLRSKDEIAMLALRWDPLIKARAMVRDASTIEAECQAAVDKALERAGQDAPAEWSQET